MTTQRNMTFDAAPAEAGEIGDLFLDSEATYPRMSPEEKDLALEVAAKVSLRRYKHISSYDYATQRKIYKVMEIVKKCRQS